YDATDTFSSAACGFCGEGGGWRSSFRLADDPIWAATLVCGVRGSAGRGEFVADA
ncbi:unnamed protein product, partial [Haemonchus placei]|uniref:Thioesterase n=1 Tax=Haemonchus placei TaxID=6290 RepID=A0A0N4WN29_HAEPC